MDVFVFVESSDMIKSKESVPLEVDQAKIGACSPNSSKKWWVSTTALRDLFYQSYSKVMGALLGAQPLALFLQYRGFYPSPILSMFYQNKGGKLGYLIYPSRNKVERQSCA